MTFRVLTGLLLLLATRLGVGQVQLAGISCDTEQGLGDSYVLAEALGVAFPIPNGFQRKDIDSDDSENIRWVRGDEVVAYERTWFVDLDSSYYQNTMQTHSLGGVTAYFSTHDEDGQTVSTLLFEDKHQDYGHHGLLIRLDSGHSDALVCHMLSGLTFINQWYGLRVLEIDDAAGLVHLKNELGTVRQAGVRKDVVTRQEGIISEIDGDTVVIQELFPDAEGGWQPVYRRLRLTSDPGGEIVDPELF